MAYFRSLPGPLYHLTPEPPAGSSEGTRTDRKSAGRQAAGSRCRPAFPAVPDAACGIAGGLADPDEDDRGTGG